MAKSSKTLGFCVARAGWGWRLEVECYRRTHGNGLKTHSGVISFYDLT